MTLNNRHILLMLAAGAINMLLTFMMSACEIETSQNGDLDGYWHLEQIDSLDNGHTADVSAQRCFWGAQLRLINATDYDSGNPGYYFRFTLTASTLTINEAYANHWHEDAEDGGDIPITDPTELQHYGVNRLPETFNIEKLNGSTMILRSEKLRMTFKKF